MTKQEKIEAVKTVEKLAYLDLMKYLDLDYKRRSIILLRNFEVHERLNTSPKIRKLTSLSMKLGWFEVEGNGGLGTIFRVNDEKFREFMKNKRR